MASLESLSNPLERLTVLPTTMNARFIGTSLAWNSAVQYFKNDIVVSGVDGGAYVLEITALKGGSDPSASASWTKLAPTGIQNSQSIAVPSTVGTTSPNVIALPVGATLTGLPAGSRWLVTCQGSVTTPTATAAADVTTFTFTPNGAGASTFRFEPTPVANTTSLVTDFGQSGVVVVGTGGSTITPTATFTGATPTLIGTITYTRIA